MEMNFCRRCGSSLNKSNASFFTCDNGHELYLNPSPSANIFLLTEDNYLLLAVRGIEPYKGKLDSFGGFIDEKETAEEALQREILEELGITSDHYSKPEYLHTKVTPYPYDGEIKTVLGIVFWAKLKPGATPTPLDDVAAIHEVSLHEVDFNDVSTDDVKIGIQKLQKIFSSTSEEKN